MQFPVFLLSERRKTGKSTLPPMGAAVKLQLPVVLLSERRKTGKSSLPPIRGAVKLQLPVFLLSERRKTGKSSLPPIRAAVKLRECPNAVASPFLFQLTWNKMKVPIVPSFLVAHIWWTPIWYGWREKKSQKLTLAIDTCWTEFLGFWIYIMRQK